MLGRSLVIGSLAAGPVFAAFWQGAHAQSGLLAGQPTMSPNEVKQAIFAATGYDPAAVELSVTNVQCIVTLVNSKLVVGPAARPENEASRSRSVARVYMRGSSPSTYPVGHSTRG